MSFWANIKGEVHAVTSCNLSILEDTGAPPPPPPPPAFVSLIPPMTGPTSNGFTAYSSSVWGEPGGEAWRMFDGKKTTSGWCDGWSSEAKATPQSPQYAGIMSPAPVETNRCDIYRRPDELGFCVISGSLIARNGAGQWVVLKTFTDLEWSDGRLKNTLTYTSQGAFDDHRIVCTDSGILCQIKELEIGFV